MAHNYSALGHSILLSMLLCSAAPNALALEVQVVQHVAERCAAPTGVLEAIASGGVPPYQFTWSTGGTTPIITDLMAGTYTVTVTDAIGSSSTADGTVIATTMTQVVGPAAQMQFPLAHCSGELPLAELSLHGTGSWGGALYGQAPFTITGPASVVSSSVSACIDCSSAMPDSVIRVTMNEPAGSQQTITWTDANGCAGSSTVTLSQEVQWPGVQIQQLQGACDSTDTGWLIVGTTQGNTNFVSFRLLGPDGAPIFSTTLEDNEWVTISRTDLGPGTYMVILQPHYFGLPTSAPCADTTIIVVDDLGPGCRNVNGYVFVDENMDCNRQGDEDRIPQALIEFTPGPYYATTTDIGSYSVNLPIGTYDHQVFHPAVQQTCLDPILVSSTPTEIIRSIGTSALDPLNAAITMASSPARPGFLMTVAIQAVNNTYANSGISTITLNFDPVLTFVSSGPSAPSTVSASSLTWSIGTLPAFTPKMRFVTFQVPPDVNLLGSLLSFTATLTTGNSDIDPGNNVFTGTQLVTGSYDPNAKQERTSSGSSQDNYYLDLDTHIDYTLQFQNTGTDTAFQVVITDTLPSSLDPTTIVVGAGSHPYTWDLSSTGVLRFHFADIELPDSTTNEAGSHGFVTFRIKPRASIQANEVIANVANIFFDYNPPIITEPSLLVVEFLSDVAANTTEQVRVAPVPMSDLLTINAPEKIRSITVLSSDGRTVLQEPVKASFCTLNVSLLSKGAYVLLIDMENGQRVRHRTIKQ